MERYPGIWEPHHTTNLIEEISEGKIRRVAASARARSSRGVNRRRRITWSFGEVGLKLFRVRSSGISSPELVDFILEGRAGSSFRRIECSMGGIWQLEDLRGKPWAHCASRGLHLELG